MAALMFLFQGSPNFTNYIPWDNIKKFDSEIMKISELKTWQKDNYLKIKDLLIRETVIVGSHDSASYQLYDNFWKFDLITAYAYTQCNSIYAQLIGGIRFIDLRIGIFDKDIRCGHGSVAGVYYNEVLDDIFKFFKEFPSEFVIINVEDCGEKLSINQKKDVLNHFLKIKDRLITTSEIKDYNDLKWLDVVDKPKNILLTSQDSVLDINPTIGVWPLIKSTEIRTGQENSLQEDLTSFLIDNKDDNKMTNLGYTLKPLHDYDIETVFKMIARSQRKNGLFNWFNNNKQRRINIITTDFVLGTDIGQQYNVVKSILEWNYRNYVPVKIDPVSNPPLFGNGDTTCSFI